MASKVQPVNLEESDPREALLLQMDKKQIATLNAQFASSIPQPEEVAPELQEFQKSGGKSVNDLASGLKDVEL